MRHHFRVQAVCLIVLLAGAQPVIGADSIETRATFLRVLEKADVSALERGMLRTIAVRPGQPVTSGQSLASLEDTIEKLSLEKARLELAIATKQHNESLAVDVVEADLRQANGQLQQAIVEGRIADRIADTDLTIRIAEKDAELSGDELDRLKVARDSFGGSVSAQQLIQRTIVHNQNLMKVEQAQYDRATDSLRSQSRKALIEQHQAALDRLQLELRQARSDREVMDLTLKTLQTSVALAEEGIARRTLKSPLNGVVAERLHHVGEWVEQGEPVFRIIGLDRLQVEGYVLVDEVQHVRPGQKAHVTSIGPRGELSVSGTVTFVSQEVDSVNRQVLVKAEIENPDRAFWPGQPAQMIILPAMETASTD